jgi:hypothetical protein
VVAQLALPLGPLAALDQEKNSIAAVVKREAEDD